MYYVPFIILRGTVVLINIKDFSNIGNVTERLLCKYCEISLSSNWTL